MGMHPKIWAGAGLLALLAACSDSDSGGGGASATVKPSLGKVYNAALSATCLGTGTLLGSGNTGSSGSASLTLSGDCSTPVLFKLTGVAGSTYFDEALGATVPLPLGTEMRALLPSYTPGAVTLALTPMTEVATQLAASRAGGRLEAVTSTQASEANQAVVSQVLGAGVSLDILKPPTDWDGSTQPGSLGTSEADRYAYHLASLARMGGVSGTPALTVMQALAADLADGTLHGTATGGFTYTPAGLGDQLQAARTAMAGYASTPLRSALGLHPPVALDGFTPASGQVGETVTLTGSGFDADPFHMRVLFKPSVAAQIISSSTTTLVVKVPDGAESGPLTVENTLSSRSQTSTASFTVTPASGGGGTSSLTISAAAPSSANGAVDTSNVIAGATSPTLTRVTLTTANLSLRVTYNSVSGLVSNVQLGWIAENALALCNNAVASIACTGVSLDPQAGRVGFDQVVLKRYVNGAPDSSVTATLNGTLTFTPPAAGWVVRQSPSGYLQSSLAYGGGTFVSVGMGPSIATSADGISWVSRTPPAGYWEGKSVIYTGTEFVLVGDANYATPSKPPMIATSADGIGWVVHPWTHGNETALTDAAFANGRITLVGVNGTILSTTDLSGSRTWSNESAGQPAVTAISYSGVADSGSVRVAVGRNSSYEGKIMVNTGSGWVAATTPVSGFCPADVVWAGSRFVAVGGASCGLSNAVAMVSTDGLNWTRVELATTVAPANHALVEAYWDGSKLFATGDNLQSSRVIVSSTDGSTWVQEHTSTASGNATLQGIASSPTRWVTVGGTNAITKP